MSRALGDLEYKSDDDFHQHEQKVICVPDIVEIDLTGVEYFVMACDGVWDHRSNQDVADWVNQKAYKGNYASNKDKVPLQEMLNSLNDLLDSILPKDEE